MKWKSLKKSELARRKALGQIFFDFKRRFPWQNCAVFHALSLFFKAPLISLVHGLFWHLIVKKKKSKSLAAKIKKRFSIDTKSKIGVRTSSQSKQKTFMPGFVLGAV